jgi:hypothetical protein
MSAYEHGQEHADDKGDDHDSATDPAQDPPRVNVGLCGTISSLTPHVLRHSEHTQYRPGIRPNARPSMYSLLAGAVQQSLWYIGLLLSRGRGGSGTGR